MVSAFATEQGQRWDRAYWSLGSCRMRTCFCKMLCPIISWLHLPLPWPHIQKCVLPSPGVAPVLQQPGDCECWGFLCARHKCQCTFKLFSCPRRALCSESRSEWPVLPQPKHDCSLCFFQCLFYSSHETNKVTSPRRL